MDRTFQMKIGACGNGLKLESDLFGNYAAFEGVSCLVMRRCTRL